MPRTVLTKKLWSNILAHTNPIFLKRKMRQPGERNKVISKVLAFSWQGIWVIACQLLVTAAKNQDCCAQIAGNGHLLFVNFYLSRGSAKRLLRSAGKRFSQSSQGSSLPNTEKSLETTWKRGHLWKYPWKNYWTYSGHFAVKFYNYVKIITYTIPHIHKWICPLQNKL